VTTTSGLGFGINLTATTFLRLQQLASPVLPVGAYSYSEGLEMLVEDGTIDSAATLQSWLEAELNLGSMAIEGAMLARAYRAVQQNDPAQLQYWNNWWSAARETHELRQQSWQMGRSLIRLLRSLDGSITPWFEPLAPEANWAIGFGLAAAHWEIDLAAAVLAYLQGWATNLMGAGVKLVPLGQTAGQQLLWDLAPVLGETVDRVLGMEDGDLVSCSWGVALASSQHEMQGVRLFQS
jgi:urease accessory protein